MGDNNDSETEASPSGINRYVPHLVGLMIILVAVVIPVKILCLGYLPEDDGLRYAAKAVSGKSWPEILVMGGNYTVDHNFGYDLLLRQIYLLAHWDAEALLDLTLVGFFALLGICAVPWLKRPEAWLGALLVGAAGWPPLASRMMIGRPLLLTAFALLTVLFLWHKRNAQPPGRRITVLLAGLIGLTVWTHGVWYLWVLPVTAFLLAGEYQWAAALACAWGMGTVGGAVLTGHPLAYLHEAVLMSMRATALHQTARTMVSELQPVSGGLLIFLVPGALLVLRRLANLEVRPLTRDPIFWMAVLGWLLGFAVRRFWEDWGLWALLALAACDLSLFLQSRLAANSARRLALTGCLALAAYMTFTSDLESRWTQSLSRQFLAETDPDLAGWLPDRGGILYAADPGFFYDTFFKNPHADWRYLLGFEMTLMPADDFETLYRILWNNAAPESFQPWVAKMRPEDRLFIRTAMTGRPPIPGLEWHYTLGGMWSGRLPRTNSPPAQPANP
jgi:hypothetical protein